LGKNVRKPQGGIFDSHCTTDQELTGFAAYSCGRCFVLTH